MPVMQIKPKEILQRISVFVKHWTREIIIALVLAVIAAFMADPFLDWYKEQSNDKIIETNKKAIAVITVYDKNHEEVGQGSGFFVSSDGKLATNYHVIDVPDFTEIRAQLPETKATYFAKGIITKDVNKDYVLLQFDANDTPYVRLGDSNTVKSGQKVIAIGAPLGLENTVSEGVISNTERQVRGQKFIQFTAPISAGSSGGGLFNKQGKAIGVTAAYLGGTPEEPGHDLNLAVPINLVRDKLSDKSILLPTDKATNYYFLGQLETNKHNYDQALDYYKQSLVLDDTNSDAYIGAANAFYEKNDYKSEAEYLERAVSLSPKDYIAIYTLGTAYEDLGRYNDAIKMYKEALRIEPDDKDSMFYLAFLSVLMGDINTARQILPALMERDEGIGREIASLIKLASH